MTKQLLMTVNIEATGVQGCGKTTMLKHLEREIRNIIALVKIKAEKELFVANITEGTAENLQLAEELDFDIRLRENWKETPTSTESAWFFVYEKDEEE